MNNKDLTNKQVYILVFAIIAGIAFMESSHSISTGIFWREYILKILGYGLVIEFIVVLLAGFMKES
ncbi:MAG: hypothetical protein A3A33_01050 [Candidatus Yanofskybacteria bacterium RIFCSPLOWO2_01_FULL_49_25]|uniref:Uncharacterized protein n=1 Tax=Candidatus Yanofskybacteria bacterium RIFCSPLOWO2_01_FULL_49_25 TaxID=1802701 RepID=A0A1F8GZF9_9BACT|nr:MAG: hypothetical protein A3A33_01050 [Candidatus Yanofskybacteria bacterium RIFCSPLOWO2_01_FULL_49_25]